MRSSLQYLKLNTLISINENSDTIKYLSEPQFGLKCVPNVIYM